MSGSRYIALLVPFCALVSRVVVLIPFPSISVSLPHSDQFLEVYWTKWLMESLASVFFFSSQHGRASTMWWKSWRALPLLQPPMWVDSHRLQFHVEMCFFLKLCYFFCSWFINWRRRWNAFFIGSPKCVTVLSLFSDQEKYVHADFVLCFCRSWAFWMSLRETTMRLSLKSISGVV